MCACVPVCLLCYLFVWFVRLTVLFLKWERRKGYGWLGDGKYLGRVRIRKKKIIIYFINILFTLEENKP